MRLHTRYLSDSIILLLIISLGIIIMLLPLNSSYPIGCDAGSYVSFTAGYTEAWPLIPQTLPFYGGISATERIPPLQPWLMAGLHKLSGLDLFRTVQITPILIYIFTALAVYFLAREITGKRYIALISAFLYSTSKLYFSIIYPTSALRTHFGILFITLFFLFMLRAMRSNGEARTRGWITNAILSGLFFSAVIATHDFSIFSLAVITGSFVVLGLLFARRRFIASYRPILTSIFAGVLLSIPILILWGGFFLERVSRMLFSLPTAANVEAGKGHILHLWEVMGTVPYGYLASLFAVIGIVLFLVRKPKPLGHYLILGWLLSMYALANLHLVGIYSLSPHRLLSYGIAPVSIFAAIGISQIVTWIATAVGDLGRYYDTKIAVFCLIGLIVVPQVFEATTTIMQAPSARTFMTKAREEAMLWLKESTPQDSIVFTARLPYATPGYVAGISGRTTTGTLTHRIPPGEYLEYERKSEATEVVSLEHPELVDSILNEYSESYSKGYLFVPNTATIAYDPPAGKISRNQLYSHYGEPVFENREIVIFELY